MKKIIIYITIFAISFRANCQYNSSIHKIDFYSGSASKIAWAGAFINLLEQKDYNSIKETFNIDSGQISKEANYIYQNFNWPQEVKPGWLQFDDGKEHYVRTYFERLGDTYSYKYQVEVSFDKDNSPEIAFRQNEKVIEMDDILNAYYKRMDNLSESTDSDPEHPCQKVIIPDEKWLQDAMNFEGANDFENALKNYDKYLWKNPEDTRVLFSKLEILVTKLSKDEEGIKVCDKLISLNEQELNYYSIRAELHKSIANYEQSIEDYKKSQEPNFEESIAVILMLQNKNEEALKTLNEIKSNERSENYFFTKAVVLKKLNRLSELKTAVDSLVILKGKDINQYYSIAVLLYEIEEFDKSVYFYKKSLGVLKQTGEDKNQILLNLSEALITNNQFLESQKITEQLLQIKDLTVKDRIIYLYLNVIARYLVKNPYTQQQLLLDKLINEEKVEEKGNWNVDQFAKWLEDSTKISKEDKVFVNNIIEKIKKAL
ncbi:MAG: hypothetical protein KA313_09075 [Pseudarcicella sp.]|nr:hypothetical protein [Pseudarcicella sp.]MBP6411237.1 hypothetical protein [Pseudarcicella sp.]